MATPTAAASSTSASISHLTAESSRRRAQIASEIEDADDPLALYDQFIKWIFDKYPQEYLGSSGLLETVEEATRRYKDDSSYKSDLRYLKMWCLFASLVDKPSVVYKFVLSHGIGTVYALLYEDYALALERDGRCVIPAPKSLADLTPDKDIQQQMKFIVQAYSVKLVLQSGSGSGTMTSARERPPSHRCLHLGLL